MDGTALRTLEIGTQAFMAPELFGQTDSYTAAVDAWSLGAVTFHVRTGNPPFRSQMDMFEYARGMTRFPIEPLASSSALCASFIRDAMVVSPTGRLTIEQALHHPWLSMSLGVNERYGYDV
jgi:serine/threonine protein kinase